MNPTTQPEVQKAKRLRTILVVFLSLILLAILGTYIYLGMQHARSTAEVEQLPDTVPLEDVVTDDSVGAGTLEESTTSTLSEQERLDILENLTRLSEGDESVDSTSTPSGSSSVTPPTPPPTVDPEVKAQRLRRLEQMNNLESGEMEI